MPAGQLTRTSMPVGQLTRTSMPAGQLTYIDAGRSASAYLDAGRSADSYLNASLAVDDVELERAAVTAAHAYRVTHVVLLARLQRRTDGRRHAPDDSKPRLRHQTTGQRTALDLSLLHIYCRIAYGPSVKLTATRNVTTGPGMCESLCLVCSDRHSADVSSSSIKTHTNATDFPKDIVNYYIHSRTPQAKLFVEPLSS